MTQDVDSMDARAVPAAPAPMPERLRDSWLLDPQIAFLNHGSFGARPKSVFEAQVARQRSFEWRPIELLDRRRNDLLAETRRELGEFLGMAPADFGFVTNATGGVNAVMRSLDFAPGDEILTTNHVYNGVRMTMRHLAGRTGATATENVVPLPVHGPDDITDAVCDAISERTRLLVVDHVSSETALIFPVERIIARCADLGVDVLVDGAHAPGMIELDVQSLGAAYYTGNLHKWMCAPKGAAFLWVRPDRQAAIHPNTISHFLGEGLANEFSWQGTRDITPWLGARDAIAFFRHYGWARLRAYNHELATWAQHMLCDAWNVEPVSPLDGSMIGSMATVALPGGLDRFETVERLQAELYDRYHIEVPVICWMDRWWIRVSAQVYNVAEEYTRLAEAVLELQAEAP